VGECEPGLRVYTHAGFWILKVVFTYCVYEIYGELDLISRDQIKSKGERLDWTDLFFEQILD